MAKTKLAPPARFHPTDEYWQDVRTLHQMLVGSAEDYYGGWWHATASHSWNRIDAPDEHATVDDRRLTVSWDADDRYGRRRKQGVLRMSRLMLQGTDADNKLVHGIERVFMYEYGMTVSEPRAFVYNRPFEIHHMRDNEKFRRVCQPVGRELVQQAYNSGLLDPSPIEYEEMLVELAIGAGGHGRVY